MSFMRIAASGDMRQLGHGSDVDPTGVSAMPLSLKRHLPGRICVMFAHLSMLFASMN